MWYSCVKLLQAAQTAAMDIHVASLAGIPEVVLQHARDILHTLELEKAQHRPRANQMELFAEPSEPVASTKPLMEIPEVVQELAAVNVDHLNAYGCHEFTLYLSKKSPGGDPAWDRLSCWKNILPTRLLPVK